MAGQRPEKRREEKRLAEHGALTCCLLTQVAGKQLPAPRRRACALKEQKCEGGRRKKKLSLITLCLYRAPTNAQQVAPETRKKKNKAKQLFIRITKTKYNSLPCSSLLFSSSAKLFTCSCLLPASDKALALLFHKTIDQPFYSDEQDTHSQSPTRATPLAPACLSLPRSAEGEALS